MAFAALRVLILTAILLILLPRVSRGQTEGVLIVNGGGIQTNQPLFYSWTQGYLFSSTFVQLNYVVESDVNGAIAEVASTESFSTSYYVSIGSHQVPIAQAAGLASFPLAAYAIALPYRLDGVNATVQLSMELLGLIYTGQIIYWNDTQIAALNSGLTLPAIRIRPIAYIGACGPTLIFTQAVSELDTSGLWNSTVVPPIGDDVEFPLDPAYALNATCDTSGINQQVASNNGALGFGVNVNIVSSGLKIASINRGGQTVMASPSTITAALASLEPVIKANLTVPYVVNPPDNTAWPMCAFSFISVPPNASTLCEQRGQLGAFIAWTQLNAAAKGVTTGLGYGLLTLGIRTTMFDQLTSIQCNGSPIQTTNVVSGIGVLTMATVLLSWSRVYTLTHAGGDVYVDFESASRTLTIATFLANDVKFSSQIEPYVADDYAIAPDILQVPVLALGMAIFYNIPNITDSDPLMILSLDLLARIYLNLTTYWDDPEIVELNPDLPLPHFEIIVVTRQGENADTLVFTAALNDAVPSYGIPPVINYTWPLPPERNIIASSGVVLQTCDATPYSIAYDDIPTFNDDTQQQLISRLRQAKIINKAGNAVSADPENVQAAVHDFSLQLAEITSASHSKRDTTGTSGTLGGSIVGGSGAQSYPLSTYGYMAIRKDAQDSNCAALSQFFNYIVWTQTYTGALSVLTTYGATRLPPKYVNQVLDTLATVECNGVRALVIKGCLRGDKVCSDNGYCSNGFCICDSGYSGTYCQDSAGLDTTVIIGVLATVIPTFLICCVILLLIAIVLAIIYGRGKEVAWAVDFSELELKQQIGAGGYGTVHKGVWKDTDVAVKLLAGPSNLSRESKNDFVREVKIMTRLRHPNVVLFMGACTKPPNLCIIMEFMELGSLYDVLHNELVPRLPMGLKIKLAVQAAQGMNFLHSSGILHRDLKSPNILLDDKWNAKISDFGLTKFKQDGTGSDVDRIAGSLYWVAPEILGEEMPFAEPADVYSFGIILWELLTSEQPYAGMNPTTVAVSVLRDDVRPKIPEDALPDYAELIENCWDREIDVRPAFLEVLTRLKTMQSSTSTGGESVTQTETSIGASNPLNTDTEVSGSSSSDSGELKGNEKKLRAIDNAMRAPVGEIVIGFTDIFKAGTLWEFDPDLMMESTILHNNIVRNTLKECKGYEVNLVREGGAGCGEGSFCVAFQVVEDAVNWAICLQTQLLAADWPEKLLTHPLAAEEVAGQDDTLIFRGLRVRMGLHLGTPRPIRDPMTRRIEYVGAPVGKAARVTNVAQGGQIVVTAALYKSIKNNAVIKEVVSIGSLGLVDLGTGANAKLYVIKPRVLAGRFFGGVSQKYGSRKDGSKTRSFPSLSSSLQSTTPDTSEVEMNSMNKDEDEEEETLITSANLCRWIIDFKNIELGKQIGLGSYGTVYKGRWKAVDVAVKRFIKQKMSERQMLEFRAEVAFLSEMHHPHIVLFIGACMRRPNLCIVTEYLKNGSLKDVLQNKSIKLPWQIRMKIAKGAALGVFYLHSLDPVIVHRDLKSANILIDENWNAKVADFGFARIKQDNATMTRCGSPCWTAPEIIKGTKYTEKADVYSFAIILWELLTRQQPYKGQNYMNVSMDVVNGIRPKLPGNTPRSLARIITRCWRTDAEKRPSMQSVVQFFDNEESIASESVSSDSTDGKDNV